MGVVGKEKLPPDDQSVWKSNQVAVPQGVELTTGALGIRLKGNSVAEVQFRTDAENLNRPNRTDSSVQFWFSPATLVVSSVLGSQISSISRTSSEPVRTGPNH